MTDEEQTLWDHAVVASIRAGQSEGHAVSTAHWIIVHRRRAAADIQALEADHPTAPFKEPG